MLKQTYANHVTPWENSNTAIAIPCSVLPDLPPQRSCDLQSRNIMSSHIQHEKPHQKSCATTYQDVNKSNGHSPPTDTAVNYKDSFLNGCPPLPTALVPRFVGPPHLKLKPWALTIGPESGISQIPIIYHRPLSKGPYF